MKIETKFNIGQEVYIIEHKEVTKWNVRYIQCNASRGYIHTFYEIENNGSIYMIWEEELFATREEAEAKSKESLAKWFESLEKWYS